LGSRRAACGAAARERPANCDDALLTFPDLRRRPDDDHAGSAIRPPGLLNGIAETPSTGDFASDVKSVVAGAIAKGALRPVLLLNTGDQIDLAVALFGGNAGLTVLPSNEIPPGRLIASDSASFVAVGNSVEIDVSDQVSIHEDTAPAAIVPPGGPMSSPVRSTWQTNTVGIRCLIDVGWGSAGRTAWTDHAPTP